MRVEMKKQAHQNESASHLVPRYRAAITKARAEVLTRVLDVFFALNNTTGKVSYGKTAVYRART